MKGILANWNMMRFIRLLLGVVVIVQGINNGQLAYLFLGGVLAVMALANAGCCGAGGCAVDTRSRKEEKEVIYEEVDSTK